jgi:hypothetical protein
MTSFSIQLFGQIHHDSLDLKNIKTEKVTENEYLLDSIKIDLKKVWLDPDNIKEIYVIKNRDSSIFGETVGTICINSKKRNRKWICLSDIKSNTIDSINLKNRIQIVYLIDDKFIQDTSNVRIENTCITNIEILKEDKVGVIRDPAKVTYLITTKLSKKH